MGPCQLASPLADFLELCIAQRKASWVVELCCPQLPRRRRLSLSSKSKNRKLFGMVRRRLPNSSPRESGGVSHSGNGKGGFNFECLPSLVKGLRSLAEQASSMCGILGLKWMDHGFSFAGWEDVEEVGRNLPGTLLEEGGHRAKQTGR